MEPGRLVPDGLRENAAGSRPVRRVPSETRCSFGRSFRRKFPAGPGRKHQNGILALNCHCRVIPGYVVDAPAAATKRAAGFARNPTHRARSGGVSPEPPSPSPGSNPAGSIAFNCSISHRASRQVAQAPQGGMFQYFIYSHTHHTVGPKN